MNTLMFSPINTKLRACIWFGVPSIFIVVLDGFIKWGQAFDFAHIFSGLLLELLWMVPLTVIGGIAFSVITAHLHRRILAISVGSVVGGIIVALSDLKYCLKGLPFEVVLRISSNSLPGTTAYYFVLGILAFIVEKARASSASSRV